jgi:hypothetical protein
MNTEIIHRPTAEQVAEDTWNANADSFNLWSALGQDEKDELIEEALKILNA